MSKDWNGPIGPVTLKSSRGETWGFESLSHAADFIRRNRTHMIDRTLPRITDPEGVTRIYVQLVHILLDQHDLIVPLWRIEEEIARLHPVPYPSWYTRWKGYDAERDFRKGPVPGSGPRRGFGRYLRHMRTKAELRDLHGLEADLKDLEEFPVRVKIRARRKGIPTLWDDVIIGDSRSWKRHRKTQWKA